MSRMVSSDGMHSSGVAPLLRNLGGKIEIVYLYNPCFGARLRGLS